MPPPATISTPGTLSAGQLVEQGVQLAQQGQLDQAIHHFRLALQLRPDFAQGHHNLAVALAEHGQLEEALQQIQLALRYQPDYPEAYYNLGNLCLQLERLSEAIQAFQEVVCRVPDHRKALNNLGLCLTRLGRQEEATVYLRHLVRLAPENPEGWQSLGLALSDLGDHAEAIRCFEEALRLRPVYPDAHANLGNTYKACGQLRTALGCYDLALLLEPGAVTTRWNRALTLLQLGDYERGWAEYEVRHQKPNSGIRPFAQPLWDGTSLRGRTILIHMEQGLGDMIQAMRFLPLVQAQGGTVLVTCPDYLLPLFARCAGIDRLLDERAELPLFDVQAPLYSLPALLRITLANLPNRVPYLYPDPARVERWRQPLTNIRGFKIGTAWQGNPSHPWDRHRSIPLRALAPLARVENVVLLNLQKHFGLEQIPQVRSRFQVVELMSELDQAGEAFMDTAAVLKHLDLVVTADTSIAHLAGALGVPTWIALASITDWRWLQGRDDSPWYPTVRLFQQRRLGDWHEVFRSMAEELVDHLRVKGCG